MGLLYSMIKKINSTTAAERTFFEGGSGGGGGSAQEEVAQVLDLAQEMVTKVREKRILHLGELNL